MYVLLKTTLEYTCIDTITSDEGVHENNMAAKFCHDSSTKIDIVANVAYVVSDEIQMQNNDSYQQPCTITKI